MIDHNDERLNPLSIMSVLFVLITLCFISGAAQCYSTTSEASSDSSQNLPIPEKWLLSNILANGQLSPDLQNVEFENLPVLGKERVDFDYQQSTCQLVPIVHLLQQTGCQAKAIASFACLGSCQSYVQVSNLRFATKS